MFLFLPGGPVEHHPGPVPRAQALPRPGARPGRQAVSLHQQRQVRDPVISHSAPGTLNREHNCQAIVASPVPNVSQLIQNPKLVRNRTEPFK